jgi:CHAT domain-containing protein/tetratricopeptide (TPR) repeat protein
MSRTRGLLTFLAGSVAALALLAAIVGVRSLFLGRRPDRTAEPPTAVGPARGATAEVEPPHDLLNAPPVERSIDAGERHVFLVHLAADHVVRVAAAQRGADVALAVVDPDGHDVIVVDRPIGATGTERVSLLASRDGVYRLEVRNSSTAGRYLLQVVDGPRRAGIADHQRAEAERLFMAARAIEKRQELKSYRDAVEIYRKCASLAAAAGDRQLQAISLARMGESLLHVDRLTQASEAYRQALPMLAEAGETGREAEIHNSLGVIERLRGQFSEALAHYAEADWLGAASDNEPARIQALGNRGVVEMYQGKFEKALDDFREQRARWHRLGRPRGEVDALNRIGELYTEVGEAPLALDYLDEALRLAQREGYRGGGAVALEHQANVHLLRGELLAARDLLERARKVKEALDQPYELAGILNDLGRIYRRQGSYREALEALDRALALYRRLGARRDIPVVLMHQAWVREGMGEPAAALTLYAQARAGYSAAGNPAGVASTNYGTARAELALGRLELALRDVDEALTWVESRSDRFADPGFSTSYLARKQDYFALKIEILMQLDRRSPEAGYAARALATSETSRARDLVDSLREARLGIRAGADPQLAAEREGLWKRIQGLEIAARAVELRGPSKEPGGVDLSLQLQELLAEDRRLEARLRAEDPRYAALTAPRPPSLEQIRLHLLDEDVLLLDYSLGEQRSYLWAIDRQGMTTYTLPARAVLEDAARRAYGLLARSRELRATTPLRQALQTLSDSLLGPVADRLADRPLVVVADGALHYVPFAALPVPAGGVGLSDLESEPLVSRHQVVNLPSLTVLAELRRVEAGRPAPEGAVAVVADPVFQPNDPRWPPGVPRPPLPGEPSGDLTRLARDLGIDRFDRLQHAHDEAEAILALAPPAERFGALGFDANLTTFKTAPLRRFRYLHIASHSVIDEKHPELSGLVFSLFDSQGRPIPGILRLRDLYDLDLPVDLVVLSACRTALGEEVRGEGLVGLTRGFMSAGAPRVVVSLWNVDDRATAALMKRFYRGLLREGQTPAAALRAAQDSLRRVPGWGAPFYWAGFVLQGEWH